MYGTLRLVKLQCTLKYTLHFCLLLHGTGSLKLGLVSEKRKKRMVFSEPYKIMKPIGSGTAELLAHLTAETGQPVRGFDIVILRTKFRIQES